MKRYSYFIIAVFVGLISVSFVFTPERNSENELATVSEKLSSLRSKRSSYQKKLEGFAPESVNSPEVRTVILEVEAIDHEIIRETEKLLSLLREA